MYKVLLAVADRRGREPVKAGSLSASDRLYKYINLPEESKVTRRNFRYK